MKKYLMAILLVILLQGVLANEYYISIRQEGENLLVNHIISLEEKQEISIRLPRTYEGLQSDNEFVISENYIKFNDEKIVFNYIQPKSDSFGSLDYFLLRFESSVKMSKCLIDFLVDKNYLLEKDLILPKDFELISYEDMNLISWNFYDFNSGEFKIFLDKKNNYVLYALFILALLLFGFSVMGYIYMNRNRNVEYLLEDERKIIELLRKSNRRENWQRKIQEELGFSKAKLSRMVRNLESRGLIEKVPIGNTNKIKLK